MNHSPVLARAIQFALRPHLFGRVIDRAQTVSALAQPPEDLLIERAERNAPEGWRLTEKARERVMQLNAAPGRAARRRLLAKFRADPTDTFEPDILYFETE